MPNRIPHKNEKAPIFAHGLPQQTPALMALWDRHLRCGTSDTEAQLVAAYATLSWIVAARLKKRHPILCADSIDEMASDGLLGLLCAVRATTTALTFLQYASKCIRGYILRSQATSRGWSIRQHGYRGLISSVRAGLVQEHGRMPTPLEMSEQLAGIITNPQIQVGEQPRCTAFSDLRNSESDWDARPRTLADPNTVAPDARLLSRETMRLALKGLNVADRKILKQLMRGMTQSEIARQLNVSRQRIKQRLNGVLWEARGRADLARHANAQAKKRPAVKKRSELPTPVRGAARLLAS
jgi:RNA polymerase sigma factor (sigma-70 family)